MEQTKNVFNAKTHSKFQSALETSYLSRLERLRHGKSALKNLQTGKQIGYFKIGKEIGIGNFSSVKIGVHILSKGIHI